MVTHRYLSVRFALFVLILVLAAGNAVAAGMPVRRIAPGDIPNEYIVGLQGVPREKVDAAAREIAAKAGGQVVAVWKDAVTAFWVRIPAERAASMFADSRVKSIEQNARVYPSATVPTGVPAGDPDLVQPTPAGAYPNVLQPHPLWNLSRMSTRARPPTQTPAANDPWFRYTYTSDGPNASDGHGVTAYVVDTGVLRFHQEFVAEGVPAEGAHTSPSESEDRIKEIPGSNPYSTLGPDRFPSSAPYPDCSVVAPFEPSIAGLRWHSQNPWFETGAFGASLTDHGTGVASVLGGRNVGVARKVTIVPVKVVACGDHESMADYIAGIDWIKQQEKQYLAQNNSRRPAVAVMSFFLHAAQLTASDLLLFEQAVKALTDYGIPVFASANNFRDDACRTTPARLSRRGGLGKVISVGNAAKSADVRAESSNYGVCVDIMAPADMVATAYTATWSAYRPTGVSGTSYAAPLVAGIAARLMSEDPSLTSGLTGEATTAQRDANAAVTEAVWKRIAASATVRGEPQGAPPLVDGESGEPFGENSPNRLAYAGAIAIKRQPQSIDLPEGSSSSPASTVLDYELAIPARPVCSTEWFDAANGDYANSTRVGTAPTYTVQLAGSPHRKWYWARVATACSGGQPVEYVDTAMAVVTVGGAVITVQPKSAWVTAVSPAPATLTIDYQSASSNVTVEWYQGVRGDTSEPVGSNSKTLDLTDLIDETTTFWARVRSSFVVDSDVAQIRKCIALRTGALQSSFEGSQTIIRFQDLTINRATAFELQTRAADGSWRHVIEASGSVTPMFKVESPDSSRTYRIRSRSECESIDSPSITVDTTPNDPPCMFLNAENYAPVLVPGTTQGVRPTLRGGSGSGYPGETVSIREAGGRAVATYSWHASNIDGTNVRTLGTGPQTVDHPVTHTLYWAMIDWCGAPKKTGTSVYLIRPEITVQPVDSAGRTTGPSLTVQARDIVFGTQNLSYQWYREGRDDDNRIAIVKVDGQTTSDLMTSTTGRYFVRVTHTFTYADTSYTAYTDSKWATVTCPKPRHRAVRHSTFPEEPVSIVSQPGVAVKLSVDDDNDGTVFEWFEGNSYSNTSVPAGNGSSIWVTPVVTTTYWARMTRYCGGTAATENSDPMTVVIDCKPVINSRPESAIAAIVEGSVSTTAGVSGKSPITYLWTYADGSPLPDATNSPTYTWTYVAGQPKQRHVKVKVTNDCDSEGKTSDVATLTFVDTTPQRVFAYSKATPLYTPGMQGELYVRMDPQPSDAHVYTYEWFRDDGTPAGEKLAGNGPDFHVHTDSIDRFWAKVTGTHTVAGTTYQEVSTSKPMYVWQYGSCELPPLRVTQSLYSIDPGVAGTITFQAFCDWFDAELQWYSGQSGDTRDPIATDPNTPDRLTVSTGSLSTYWVRVSRPCGAVQDSPTLTFRRGSCGPVLIDQNIASVDVAYGGTATLTVQPPSATNVSYLWYEGIDASAPIVQNSPSPSYTRTNVTESGRFFVRVRDNTCTSSSDSFVATIRVATCDSIPAPQTWQTELWTNAGTPATLSAQAVGTSYKWFRGEVGDDSDEVLGVASATFTTPALSADAKYWVRISNGTCSIDSPTMTVKVCHPPVLVGSPTYNLNLVSGQWAVFGAPVTGTDLTFQWYLGPSGTTTTPVGYGYDRLDTWATQTTQYWVRVTGRCGVYDSPTYTASVCAVPGTPTAALTNVMPGEKTTLSVDVSGNPASYQYQWYFGPRGNTADIYKVPNGAARVVETPAINGEMTFWCRVTSGQCNRDSDTVTVRLCSEPTIRWQHGDKNISKGEQVFFFFDAEHSAGEVMVKVYAGATAGDLANSTLVYGPAPYSFSRVVNETTKYWARAQVGNCWADTNVITVTVCIPRITTHPANAGITTGASHTLTVGTDIVPVGGYQWYIGETGDLSAPVAGGTGPSLTVSPTVDTKYWVRVKGCGSSEADSTAALVSVCTPPDVTSQTIDHWIEKGVTKELHVSVTGTNLTYRWYRGTAGDTTNAIGNDHSVFVNPTNTTSYWCRVSNGCGSDDSTTITISVCAPPVIITQPLSQRIFSGKTATLTVAATQATTTPMTYQWFSGATSGSGTPIAGATSATFTTPALTASASYWVRVTAGTCQTNSNVATVSMCAYNETINAPADREIALGATVRLDLLISPVPQAYRWYRGAQGVRTNLIGSQSYVDVNPTETTQYWADITHDGCTAMTRTITVWVVIPTITAQPASVQINSNQTATLTVTANTPGLTYQWFQGTSGSGTAVSSPSATPSFTTPPLTATTSYWVKVTGSRGHTVNSDTATVTVCAPATITTEPPQRSIQKGGSTTLSVQATGTNLRYQWYRGAVGTTTNTAGTTASITVSPTVPTTYWVRVTSDCGSDDSAAAQVDVCATPVIQTQPASQVIYSGRTATLSVVATQETGLGMTYQWYQGASPSGTIITGATSASFTTPVLTNTAQYYVKITSGVCNITSNTATISICAYNETVNLPDDKDIPLGGTTRLQLQVSPVPQGYKWYRGMQNDRTYQISAINYADVSPTVTTQYWGEFTHDGCTMKTRTITVWVSVPAITVQPASHLVNPGQGTSLTVTATPGGLTYQWYEGPAGGGTPVPGGTAATLPIAARTAGATGSFWVKITGSRGHVVNSDAAIVTWCTPANITVEPVNRSIRRGNSTTLSVEATGTNLRYQWYRGASGVETYPLNNGATSSVVVAPVSPETYWAKVTSDCGSDNSVAAKVDVCIDAVINTQPLSHSVYNNTSATLTVNASSPTGLPLTYQWYRGASGGGTILTGETNATLITPPLTTATSYWVKVTNGVCTVYSDTATVSICSYGPTVNAPQDYYTARGQANLLKVTMNPTPTSGAWYRGVQGDRTNKLSNQLIFNVYPEVTTQYWGEFTGADGCKTMTRTVTVNVCVPTITAQPQSTTVPYGGRATLSVTALDGATYAWYTNSGYIAGATSPTFQTPPLTSTKEYWVAITGSCGRTVNSEGAVVTVD